MGCELVKVGMGMGVHPADGDNAGRLPDQLVEALQIEVKVGQRIAACVVDENDHTEGTLGKDSPHEVESLLARCAVKPELFAVFKRQLAKVQAGSCHGLCHTG